MFMCCAVEEMKCVIQFSIFIKLLFGFFALALLLVASCLRLCSFKRNIGRFWWCVNHLFDKIFGLRLMFDFRSAEESFESRVFMERKELFSFSCCCYKYIIFRNATFSLSDFNFFFISCPSAIIVLRIIRFCCWFFFLPISYKHNSFSLYL